MEDREEPEDVAGLGRNVMSSIAHLGNHPAPTIMYDAGRGTVSNEKVPCQTERCCVDCENPITNGMFLWVQRKGSMAKKICKYKIFLRFFANMETSLAIHSQMLFQMASSHAQRDHPIFCLRQHTILSAMSPWGT